MAVQMPITHIDTFNKRVVSKELNLAHSILQKNNKL